MLYLSFVFRIGPALNPNDRASVLEKKVFKLQEELTDLHRNKGQVTSVCCGSVENLNSSFIRHNT